MDDLTILSTLIELAEQAGMTVRRAPAGEGSEHPGGACVRLGKKQLLFLDPLAPTADQINVAASALRGCKELEDQFLPPEIRRRIDEQTA